MENQRLIAVAQLHDEDALKERLFGAMDNLQQVLTDWENFHPRLFLPFRAETTLGKLYRHWNFRAASQAAHAMMGVAVAREEGWNGVDITWKRSPAGGYFMDDVREHNPYRSPSSTPDPFQKFSSKHGSAICQLLKGTLYLPECREEVAKKPSTGIQSWLDRFTVVEAERIVLEMHAGYWKRMEWEWVLVDNLPLGLALMSMPEETRQNWTMIKSVIEKSLLSSLERAGKLQGDASHAKPEIFRTMNHDEGEVRSK